MTSTPAERERAVAAWKKSGLPACRYDVNATLVSLLASCQMHGIEPYAYLRDLFCLVPSWPQTRVLELAPANWRATTARPEVAAQLDANVYRQVTVGTRLPTNELPKVS